MADQPTNGAPPPAYGSVISNAPQPTAPGYPPPSIPGPPAGSAPDGYAPQQPTLPPYSGPQPGIAPAPGAYPSEPPPKYEPQKQQPMPNAGVYPGAGYPAGYQSGPVYPSQAVVVAQDPCFSSLSKTMQCPYCQTLVTTSMTYRTGGLTWLACGLLCLFGCWGGCCLIPFCMQDLQDVEHTCPSCQRTVGVYHRL